MRLFVYSIAIFLFFLGILAITNKYSFLIEDLFTKLKKNKPCINKDGLGLFSGIGCICVSLEIIAMLVFADLRNIEGALTLRYVLLFTLMYLIAGSQKYDSNNFNSKGKYKMGTKVMVLFAWVIIVMIASIF